ncbi:MAG: type II 3-dehydroquinate dehydratase [Bacteroidota bacterium]|nr:type II 3-dehydroquinate dehydratase [Bacteroidota bacterium]
MKIMIINGPNLNLLGVREPEKYGKSTFEDYFNGLKAIFPQIQLEYFQSNVEGELINCLHRAGFSYDGIILNAGGYTHTSIAIGDAVAAIQTPLIEVHITNIWAREDFRQQSFISKNAAGIISGFGLKSYELAIHSFL